MNLEVNGIIDYPFDKKYIDRIDSILKRYDPFLILGIEDESNKYSIFNFAYLCNVENKTITAYLDRNILSYLNAFVKSGKRCIDEQKLALSAVIFLNLFDTKYDFVQSIFELNSSGTPSQIKDEMISWRLLDTYLKSQNLHKALDFLIGNCDNINNFPINHDNIELSIDLSPDISWYSAYIHLLKMASLEKKNNKNVNGLFEYLDWVVSEYKSDTSAIYFSLFFFSTKKQYKKIYTDLKVIKNKAWDLTHITYWFRQTLQHFGQDKVIDVLVSNDYELKIISQILAYSVISREKSVEKLERLIEQLYSSGKVKLILEKFHLHSDEIKNNKTRKRRSFNDIEEKKKIIKELENEITGKR